MNNTDNNLKGDRVPELLYINLFYYFLANPIARILKNTRVTPNQITFIAIIISIIASCIMVFSDENNAYLSIPIILLLPLFNVLDGTLAREKNLFTAFGDWINRVSERVEYLFIGTAFACFTYKVTFDIQLLFFALVSLAIREGIGVLNTFTKISVKNSDQLVFMKYFKTSKNKFFMFLRRTFTYGGNMYILLICIGIIFKSHYLLIYFMLYYGIISYLLGLIIIGKEIYNLSD
tara:strand:- start:4531 stop:5232 length:702 start_codon:yes stop_codon:yes gene_type:complete